VRFTRDRPLNIPTTSFISVRIDRREAQERDSYLVLGGLPELFPEYLPDKNLVTGIPPFGMIYEKGKIRVTTCLSAHHCATNRVSTLLYLNCASATRATVRDARRAANPHGSRIAGEHL